MSSMWNAPMCLLRCTQANEIIHTSPAVFYNEKITSISTLIHRTKLASLLVAITWKLLDSCRGYELISASCSDGCHLFAERPVDHRRYSSRRAWVELKSFHHIASTPSSVFTHLHNRLATFLFFIPLSVCVFAAFLSGGCLPQMASCLSLPYSQIMSVPSKNMFQ